MVNENQNSDPDNLASRPMEEELKDEYVPTAEDLAFFAGDSDNPDYVGFSRDNDLDLESALRRYTPEVNPKVADDLVAKYHAFQEALHPEAGVVYHPSSANDMSPSAAFPDSHVIYADLDDNSMKALREAGLDAQTADATKFDPGPVDVLIMLNPAISPEVPASHVKEGGYALVNDYHGTASNLLEDNSFELVGILHHRTADGTAALDTENPKEYWMPAGTDEEFRSSTGYRGIGYMTQDFTGTTEPSLEQYKQAIKEAEKKPGAYEMDGYIWYEGGTRMVPCGLPPKKGHMDDFFVFRKATPESDGSDVQAAHIGAAAVEHA